jgi:hypothetical protein
MEKTNEEQQLADINFLLREFRRHESDSIISLAARLLREYYQAKADYANQILFKELSK